MDTSPIMQFAASSIYFVMGALALFGVFYVVLLFRRIQQKRFSSRAASEQFFDEVRDRLKRQDYAGVAEMCDSPPFWSKAVPQLMLVALQNLTLGPARLRRVLGEKFERDVLADLEHRTSWINTVVKSAPMLGLLGTVLGMINAFGKIAGAEATGTDPKLLANDISFALVTTALGLTIAIPLVLAGNMIHVRIAKLQDSVQDDLGQFLEDLDESARTAGRQTA